MNKCQCGCGQDCKNRFVNHHHTVAIELSKVDRSTICRPGGIYRRFRRWIIKQRGDRCEKCGTKDWLGKPLVKELDHIDGIYKHNEDENLRLLCPNCHSQTPTYKARNIRKDRLVDGRWRSNGRLTERLKVADLKSAVR